LGILKLLFGDKVATAAQIAQQDGRTKTKRWNPKHTLRAHRCGYCVEFGNCNNGLAITVYPPDNQFN
jgi:hypothetical protein